MYTNRQFRIGTDRCVHCNFGLIHELKPLNPSAQCLKKKDHFTPRQVHTHAHMYALTKPHMVMHIAGHVKIIGSVVLTMIAIG